MSVFNGLVHCAVLPSLFFCIRPKIGRMLTKETVQTSIFPIESQFFARENSKKSNKFQKGT